MESNTSQPHSNSDKNNGDKNPDKNSPRLNPLVWVPSIAAAFFALGIICGAYFLKVPGMNGMIDKIDGIMKYISAQYVDKIDTDSLLDSSINDILAKLDPHSVYIPASDLQAANEELEGSFSGIGVTFNMMTDTATVLEVISGGPSDKVGIMPGDRIITINDTVAAGKKWSNEKIISRLRGNKGTTVKLGIQRQSSAKLLQFDVVRGDIPITSIDAQYIIKEGVGYVKINKFGNTTYDEFITALQSLKNQGADKYIIDLRGNTGGYLERAILMVNEFLEAGSPIVSTHGRTPESESATISDGNGSFKNAQLAVLIDEFSASASEVFAGALQDNDRGLVIGRRSFGKGLVQRQFDLPDNSAIRLTTARYYTPSGRCIQKTYTNGTAGDYGMEIVERYNHGEIYSADSAKIDKSREFFTLGGRPVFGGGGIMPDIFVPNDTTGLSTYYINAVNSGLLHKFAFNFVDSRRSKFNEVKTVSQLLKLLPSDDELLQDFANYAYKTGGLAPRWYYINLSRALIVSQLKGLIARDVLGSSGYYQIVNDHDATVGRALKEILAGAAQPPIAIKTK